VAEGFAVAIEVGSKRVFATAVAWPGWSRRGADEAEALEALLAAGPRYAGAMRAGRVRGFAAPKALGAFEVVEHLEGSATTDFGAPGTPLGEDALPVGGRELTRLVAVLRACWSAFDTAAEAAAGMALATGPRGGGRDLGKIRAHVLEADEAYLRAVGGPAPRGADRGAIRPAFLEAVTARARGDVADVGPRGGKRWPARYAVRRSAWHALDHAWEIEDRAG
jgi:hypothetical protein